jgi:hypothetical protein
MIFGTLSHQADQVTEGKSTLGMGDKMDFTFLTPYPICVLLLFLREQNSPFSALCFGDTGLILRILVKICTVIDVYVKILDFAFCGLEIDMTEPSDSQLSTEKLRFVYVYFPKVSCRYNSQARSQLEDKGAMGQIISVYPNSIRVWGTSSIPPQ